MIRSSESLESGKKAALSKEKKSSMLAVRQFISIFAAAGLLVYVFLQIVIF